MSYVEKETFLLLGGGGMVGQEIAYEIARELNPKRIVICALAEEDANETVRRINSDFNSVDVLAVGGNVFVRHEWNPSSGRELVSPGDLTKSEERREALYSDTFGKIEDALPHSELVWLIKEYKPDVIIDSINTATAISYQDVYSASDRAKEKLSEVKLALRGKGVRRSKNADQLHSDIESAISAFEDVIISQSVPQLVRHVLLINEAMRKWGTRLYLKVGTTGTGGMGLNIPYTHSEDSPSATLMEKTAVAFAHTGLLYLMARTLDGPVVKEFKPAAMIGYADIGCRTVKVKEKGKIGTPGDTFKLYASRDESLGAKGELRLRPQKGSGVGYDIKSDLKLPVVNTGENGRFTRGEFQAITAMRQMEFITPEEIARQTVLEVKGSNTGYDVIAAIDGASMNPTYRAGYLRHFATEELKKLEDGEENPSVALGELGPPELGKLLWEAYLFHTVYKKRKKDENELNKVIAKSEDQLAKEIDRYVQSAKREKLRNTIVSVGFPILRPDGKSLIRGPYIRIPEMKNKDIAEYRPRDLEKWAAKGWVDLRPSNMNLWQRRFSEMQRQAKSISDRGSAAFTREAYLWNDIRIGVVVAWIFNNELNSNNKIKFGYRIK